MDTFFTIMIKENDTSTLKLLNEKLNEGFWINERIEVGKSTVVTLRKPEERRNNRNTRYSTRLDSITDIQIENESMLAAESSGGI